MSTADDIRAEAIDRLARMQFELDGPGADDRYEDWAPRYRREVTKFVDALGDLLPTGAQWAVSHRNHSPSVRVYYHDDRESAAEHATRPNHYLVRQLTHEWMEVPQ